MSKGIRDTVHGYVEMILNDKRLEDIRQVLKLAAGKHTIDVPIKVTIGVDDSGLATVKVSGKISLAIPHWDSPIDISGQMSLFTESGNEPPQKHPDPPKPAPAGMPTPAPVEPEPEAPLTFDRNELEPAGMNAQATSGKLPVTNGAVSPAAVIAKGEPLSAAAAAKMSVRQAENEALLKRVESGELELDAVALKALQVMVEAGKIEAPES